MIKVKRYCCDSMRNHLNLSKLLWAEQKQTEIDNIEMKHVEYSMSSKIRVNMKVFLAMLVVALEMAMLPGSVDQCTSLV